MRPLATLLSAAVLAILPAAGCSESGPGTTPEEECCACVRDQACGGADFDFGACVPEGYSGLKPVSYDLACVNAKCAAECAEAEFKAP